MYNFTRILTIILLILTTSIPAAGQASTPHPEFTCGANPIVTDLLSRTSLEEWAAWIEKLSGEVPVTVAGKTTRLTIRHSQTFTRTDSAFQFVLEQLQNWSADSGQIEIQPFTIVALPNDYETRNLIVDFPGQTRPGEVVILAAHLDSLSTTVTDPSPGADDNATGVATLLEAARLLRHYRFERTVRLIFFSGEEQIEKGSQAYLSGLDAQSVVGVINLDMFGFDNDNDRCFELHVGTLPSSQTIGRCFVEAIQANGINLTYDYLTDDAVPYSDHSTFWEAGLGAVLVLENYFPHYQPQGCRGVDFNPNYHTPEDRIQFLSLPYGFDIARAALATTTSMASPLGVCFNAAQLVVSAGIIEGELRLNWQPLPGAASYHISQHNGACNNPAQIYTSSIPFWISPPGAAGQPACYQVEAIASACVSLPSTGRTITTSPPSFAPLLWPGITGWRLKPGYIPLY